MKKTIFIVLITLLSASVCCAASENRSSPEMKEYKTIEDTIEKYDVVNSELYSSIEPVKYYEAFIDKDGSIVKLVETFSVSGEGWHYKYEFIYYFKDGKVFCSESRFSHQTEGSPDIIAEYTFIVFSEKTLVKAMLKKGKATEIDDISYAEEKGFTEQAKLYISFLVTEADIAVTNFQKSRSDS